MTMEGKFTLNITTIFKIIIIILEALVQFFLQGRQIGILFYLRSASLGTFNIVLWKETIISWLAARMFCFGSFF